MTAQQQFNLSGKQRQNLKDRLANQLLTFRQQHLFSQRQLAEALRCSRRCLQYAEARAQLMHMGTRQRFRDLQKEFREKEAKAA
jgi:hypothetical protein